VVVRSVGGQSASEVGVSRNTSPTLHKMGETNEQGRDEGGGWGIIDGTH
jgi:hypothetical protein